MGHFAHTVKLADGGSGNGNGELLKAVCLRQATYSPTPRFVGQLRIAHTSVGRLTWSPAGGPFVCLNVSLHSLDPLAKAE